MVIIKLSPENYLRKIIIDLCYRAAVNVAREDFSQSTGPSLQHKIKLDQCGIYKPLALHTS